MSFHPKSRVFPFTNNEVSTLNHNQTGVYGIFKYGAGQRIIWIYVGKGDIRTRLLAHLNGDNPCILRSGATHWVGEVTLNADAREKELIWELGPSCNVQFAV